MQHINTFHLANAVVMSRRQWRRDDFQVVGGRIIKFVNNCPLEKNVEGEEAEGRQSRSLAALVFAEIHTCTPH